MPEVTARCASTRCTRGQNRGTHPVPLVSPCPLPDCAILPAGGSFAADYGGRIGRTRRLIMHCALQLRANHGFEQLCYGNRPSCPVPATFPPRWCETLERREEVSQDLGVSHTELKSKDTNVGLSQRVCIIDETCLNSLNRPQEGACQCDRALRNVNPLP